MSDIINLNQARKSRAKIKKLQQAKENRVTFGRTKAEKKLAEARNKLLKNQLNSHKKTDE